MLSGGGWSLVGLTILILCVTAIWTGRRYQNFDRLPVSFGFRGEARNLWPRNWAVWLMPAALSLILVTSIIMARLRPEHEPYFIFTNTGVMVLSYGFLSSQALMSWLIHRWAKSQPKR